MPAQFIYDTENGALTITGYFGPGGAVVIPESINGLPVVSIDPYSFDAITTLTSITIPDTVTNIGTYAFLDCFNLASATIGNGIKAIGSGAFINCSSLTDVALPKGLLEFKDSAFRGCSSLSGFTIPTNVTRIANGVFFGAGLTNVTIPRTVTSIGSSAFHPCPKLQAINVDPLNPFYTSVDGALLNKSKTILIQCPGGKAGSYAVPDSITNIGESAFSYCGTLTNVTLGSNVTAIGIQSFFSCYKLTRFTVPDKVTSIGSSAFAYCNGLTNVSIGKGVRSIGNRPFASCIKLVDVAVDPLNPSFASVDSVLFDKSLKTLVSYPGGRAGAYAIPSGVTNIAGNAFESSVYLTGVVIPHGLTRIPDYAFAHCTNLTSVTIPRGVTLLGDRAFVACSGLTRVFFSGNAPWLGSSYVFYNANKATLYYLPGTTGWSSTFGGRPAVLWNPTLQAAPPNFAVYSNHFGFAITGTVNIPLLVEAATNFTDAQWTPLRTCTLTNGSIYFADSQWTNYPTRFYRIRSP